MQKRTYKITSFNSATGQIVVEAEGYAAISIDLPVVGGLYPEGEHLDSYILGFFPPVDTSRADALAAGVQNEAAIASMVITDGSFQDAADAAKNEEMLSQIFFEQQVAKVLVKFGVLESDPTTIGVTNL